MSETSQVLSPSIDVQASRPRTEVSLTRVGVRGIEKVINVNGGRDHHPACFSVTVAGGGIEGGRVIGASDKDGFFITDQPVQVPDFMATIYQKLGVDYTKEYLSNIGRPLRIVPDGKPLAFL